MTDTSTTQDQTRLASGDRYLPSLPAGWAYRHVSIVGPEGEKFDAAVDDEGGWQVQCVIPGRDVISRRTPTGPRAALDEARGVAEALEAVKERMRALDAQIAALESATAPTRKPRKPKADA